MSRPSVESHLGNIRQTLALSVVRLTADEHDSEYLDEALLQDMQSGLDEVCMEAWEAAKELREGLPGLLWELRKGGRLAVCRLWMHRSGGEVQLEVDGEWHRGEAGLNGLAVVDVALEWKKQFQAKGWA